MILTVDAIYGVAYSYLKMIGIAFEGTVRAWSYFGVVEVSLTEVSPSLSAEKLPAVLPRLWQEVRIMFPEASPADMAQGSLQKGVKSAACADDGRTLRVVGADQIRQGGGVDLIQGLSGLSDQVGRFRIAIRPAARADNPANATCKRLRFEVQGAFIGRSLHVEKVEGALSLESLAELHQVIDSVSEVKGRVDRAPIKRAYPRAIGEEIVASVLSSADADVTNQFII